MAWFAAISIFGAIAMVCIIPPLLTLGGVLKLFVVVAALDGLAIGTSPLGATIRGWISDGLELGQAPDLFSMNVGVAGVAVVGLLVTVVLLIFTSGKDRLGVILGTLGGISLAATGLGSMINNKMNGGGSSGTVAMSALDGVTGLTHTVFMTVMTSDFGAMASTATQLALGA